MSGISIAIAAGAAVAAALLTWDGVFIVGQQHAAVVERLGRFHRCAGAGLHVKIPLLDRKVADVSLRTSANSFDIDAKTSDNVTVGLSVALQYHVSQHAARGQSESGVYKSHYMLADPEAQMRDFVTDALRSAVPSYDLDALFARKDAIARDVNRAVSEQMEEFGFTLASTLITRIALPKEVEAAMNEINAAQRKKAAAADLAEADRIRRVTEARAEAEAMQRAGEGIAAQRRAIAEGIRDSLGVIQASGVSPAEANGLFAFTQWVDMMESFARGGGASTVVLPSGFADSAPAFDQLLAASAACRRDPPEHAAPTGDYREAIEAARAALFEKEATEGRASAAGGN